MEINLTSERASLVPAPETDKGKTAGGANSLSFTLATAPSAASKHLLASHLLKNREAYRASVMQEQSRLKVKASAGSSAAPLDIFSMGATIQTDVEKQVKATVKHARIIWATDSYEEFGHNFDSPVTPKGAELIVPRAAKAKAEQKKRTKVKAEVFTPSWVCNLQNNLIDDELLYPGAFNVADSKAKTWSPSSETIDFSKAKALASNPAYSWIAYVLETRLEITCGEGPYLMSRYDTVTGEPIPVRDETGAYRRIGMLDRKLRVINENINEDLGEEGWVYMAFQAMNATYGYEWQGDNLLLARLNFLNTFVDYFVDRFRRLPGESLVDQVAEIASWQLWQMDGLKQVQPMSCNEVCVACKNKKRFHHDGLIPVVKWGARTRAFEDFLILNQ